jgi:hypothetical protein
MRLLKYTIYAVIALATNICLNVNGGTLKNELSSHDFSNPARFYEGTLSDLQIAVAMGIGVAIDSDNKVILKPKTTPDVTIGTLPLGLFSVLSDDSKLGSLSV